MNHFSNKRAVLPTPVLIVEDERGMAARLERLLMLLGYAYGDWCVARSLAEARAYCRTESFAVALIDLGLPDGSGLDLISDLHNSRPGMSVLVISSCASEDVIVMALREGATGYLLKEREDLEIQLYIQSALMGGAPIDPFIAKRLLTLMGGSSTTAVSGGRSALSPSAAMAVAGHGHPKPPAADKGILSPRETEILKLVAEGLTNREIAERLYLSTHTAACHIKNIYRKLAVSSRTKAMREARLLGLF